MDPPSTNTSMILLLRRSDRLPLEISEDFSVVDSALQWLTIKYFWMLTLANTPSLQRPETDKTPTNKASCFNNYWFRNYVSECLSKLR